ncbi:phage gp6-like head-tail connector protein [Rhizobium deserti]|uniref:Phage gp6-like head-tail connector protein n=1 Tax=Rhizobium deserti TaxID=2547961 RepID=A0A4R5ULM1_9HYPH|nr:head-tail connector protein [Rhizobium deserti]TDK38604.1 phage gp6-like head-tail connector protein [Rhizobium deserti]
MIVSVDELKQQLNLSDDLGTGDDALIGRTIAAAQGLVERQLGYAIEMTYPVEVPAALQQAVSLLACHWFENREATLVGVTGQEIPFGVREIVQEFREYSFDG